MKLAKRIIALVLSLILCLGGLSLDNSHKLVRAEGNENILNFTRKEESNLSINEEEKEALGKEAKNNEIEDAKNEDLRVIVELKDKSILEEANSKGLAYDDLDESFIDGKKKEIRQEQDRLLDRLKDEKLGGNLEKSVNYDTAINGVALTIKQKDLGKLKLDRAVRKVYIAQEFNRPFLKSSQELNGSEYAWDTKAYKGEGTVVAVIDSGLDYTHKAMKIDDVSRARYNRDKIEQLISEKGLKGKYYSDKVPYGHNYYDHSDNLFDSYGAMHGMHVSGIVGANDKEKDTYGVAPNTQILALKVFSDDVKYPTTFTDVWIKAIDDAIKLGADVINMSLGSPAGFSHEDSHPENEIFKRAKKSGILVAVAAGNEANITEGNLYGKKPLESVFDTGEIANPALTEESLAVASYESSVKHNNTIEWDYMKNKQEVINLYLGENPPDVIEGNIVDVSKGEEADIKSKEDQIRDRIVLMELPKEEDRKNYIEKINALVDRSPKAIVLYNSKDSKDVLGAKILLFGKASKYTLGIVKRESYEKLIKDYTKDEDLILKINTKLKEIPNENFGKMSRFSAWGPTPDLRIKPEITGPGGNIYSVAEDQKYKNMSGTSMASPQIAGASAILKQHLRTINSKYANDPEFIKLLLMNTGQIINDKSNNKTNTPYFVRQQGAGRLNIKGALDTEVVARIWGTNDQVKDGKLELKELGDKKFNFDLELENLGDKDRSFMLELITVYEPIVGGERQQEARLISKRPKLLGPVSIKGGQIENKNFSIDYSDDNHIEKNSFIEGFICLKSLDGGVDLSLPFLGFYGDWTSQKSIDAFNLKEIDAEQRREIQFMVNKDQDINSSLFITKNMLPLPVVNNTVYFSPDSDYHKELAVRLAPLRNMEEIEYSILDGNTNKELFVIGKSYEIRKLNRLGFKNSFIVMPDSLWDGRINGKLIRPDGNYVYQIKTKLNNMGVGGESTQVYRYPIKIDNIKPELAGLEIEKSNENDRLVNIKLRVQDRESGIKSVYIESMRYKELDHGPTQPGINIPPGLNTPPGLDTPPGEKNPEKAPQKKETVKGKKETYGKYIKLDFVDYKIEPSGEKVNYSINNGKLVLDDRVLAKDASTSKEIKVYRNGYPATSPIEIETPYYADMSHIYFSAKDYLSNVSSQIKESGFDGFYKNIMFVNYHTQLEPNKARIFYNGIEGKNSYSTIENKLDIRIKLANRDKSIIFLSLGKGEDLISNNRVNPELAKKYAYKYDKDKNEIYLSLNNIKKDYYIVTTFGDGPMVELKEEKEVNLDLTKIESKDFSKILLDRKALSKDDLDKQIRINSGKHSLEFVFEKDKDRPVREISLINKKTGEENKLKRVGSSMDLLTWADGFYSSKYSIFISTYFDEDMELKISYMGDEDIPKAGGEGLSAESENTNNPKDKYPVIFINTPVLLDVLNEFNTLEDKFQVEGFIGNVKKDDSIEEFSLSLVDNDGNLLGDKTILKAEDLVKEAIKNISSDILYVDEGYKFSVTMDAKYFNTNIKAEVRTTKGKTASIVRRVIFDKQIPTLSYSVTERDLDSSKVDIGVKALDNSLQLNLYHNDSLVEKIDKTTVSFEKNGDVSIEKTLSLDLEEGQNEIVISATDLGNHTVEKKIYIFREKKD